MGAGARIADADEQERRQREGEVRIPNRRGEERSGRQRQAEGPRLCVRPTADETGGDDDGHSGCDHAMRPRPVPKIAGNTFGPVARGDVAMTASKDA